jgi:hypothetical protein
MNQSRLNNFSIKKLDFFKKKKTSRWAEKYEVTKRVLLASWGKSTPAKNKLQNCSNINKTYNVVPNRTGPYRKKQSIVLKNNSYRTYKNFIILFWAILYKTLIKNIIKQPEPVGAGLVPVRAGKCRCPDQQNYIRIIKDIQKKGINQL